MSGAETIRHPVIQRRIGGAEISLPHIFIDNLRNINFYFCFIWIQPLCTATETKLFHSLYLNYLEQNYFRSEPVRSVIPVIPIAYPWYPWCITIALATDWGCPISSSESSGLDELIRHNSKSSRHSNCYEYPYPECRYESRKTKIHINIHNQHFLKRIPPPTTIN